MMIKICKVVFFFWIFMLCSCAEESNPIDIPVNTPTGEYDHESTSEYFDDKGSVIRNAKNEGTVQIRFSFDSTTAIAVVTPLYGWAYDLSISSIKKVDVDGKVGFTFRIPLQQIPFDNQVAFNIKGNNNQELINSEGVVVDYNDGVIDPDGRLSFEYTSVDVIEGSKVVTLITGFKRGE